MRVPDAALKLLASAAEDEVGALEAPEAVPELPEPDPEPEPPEPPEPLEPELPDGAGAETTPEGPTDASEGTAPPITTVVELPTLMMNELREEPLPMGTVWMPEGSPAGMVASSG